VRGKKEGGGVEGVVGDGRKYRWGGEHDDGKEEGW